MTLPDISSAALDAVRPHDLSSRTFQQTASHPASGSHFSLSATGTTAEREQAGHFNLLNTDFSIEEIPLIGDFFSVISSLFTSFDGSATARREGGDGLALLNGTDASRQDVAVADRGISSDAPFDLSRLVPDMDLMPTGTIDLVGGSDQTEAGKSQSGSHAPELDFAQITGLAAHPANKIPLDTLAAMQARHMEMMSKQD